MKHDFAEIFKKEFAVNGVKEFGGILHYEITINENDFLRVIDKQGASFQIKQINFDILARLKDVHPDNLSIKEYGKLLSEEKSTLMINSGFTNFGTFNILKRKEIEDIEVYFINEIGDTQRLVGEHFDLNPTGK